MPKALILVIHRKLLKTKVITMTKCSTSREIYEKSIYHQVDYICERERAREKDAIIKLN